MIPKHKTIRSDFNFFTALPTRWGDADTFGHLNNAKYVTFLETGRIDYFTRLLDLRFEQSIEQGIILADLNITFLQQVHHPAELEIGSCISRLGNSSLDMDASIFIKNKDAPVATSKAILVWFNYKENRSQPIPRSVREKITAFDGVE